MKNNVLQQIISQIIIVLMLLIVSFYVALAEINQGNADEALQKKCL